MKSFEITEWVEGIKDYHDKAKVIQAHKFENMPALEQEVNDPLMWNVPIYDVVNRKYAAFNSLITALQHGKFDPKGNGDKYDHLSLSKPEWLYIFFTFRMTGSGINYKENHGFGNSVHQHMVLNSTGLWGYADYFRDWDGKYADTKGYQLPTISYRHLSKGHLKHFCANEAPIMIEDMIDLFERNSERLSIVQLADWIMDWMSTRGHKRFKFVATATAMDVAEMFPDWVDPRSEVYVGSNAIRCLNLTLPKKRGVKQHTWYNDALDYLIEYCDSDINKYDAEDTLGCDPIRYFQEFQSKDHIAMNGGRVYANNSIMKQILGQEEYINKARSLK